MNQTVPDTVWQKLVQEVIYKQKVLKASSNFL